MIEWNLNISEEGYYHILFDYCALESKYTNIDYSIYIDGKIPFKGADKLRLTRAWKNKRKYKVTVGEITSVRADSCNNLYTILCI